MARFLIGGNMDAKVLGSKSEPTPQICIVEIEVCLSFMNDFWVQKLVWLYFE